ncbi:MAG: response regulator transcription factor [Paludibacteraceae bacterium]|jgi:DNA-binding response OmpR family regulator|nr:response regulator transcription factor [Paludibacteraceae bacterium]MCR5298721.1 response regulator transcription factor [Paludibacteraceae bacterium]
MEQPTNILLCEDDENLGMLLQEYLQGKGLRVDLRTDGEAGLGAFSKDKYDLCILDVMMPKMDGFTLAKRIREIDPDMPIIFLTAKSMKDDILEGFKIGADDYISKPFSMDELLFRMEAILRRVRGKKNKDVVVYHLGKFVFNTQTQTLSIGDKKKHLTTKENGLLQLLAANVNNILEREYALKAVWDYDNRNSNQYYKARSMDVYITKLRKLLSDDPTVQIVNIHGYGYKLVAPVEENKE